MKQCTVAKGILVKSGKNHKLSAGASGKPRTRGKNKKEKKCTDAACAKTANESDALTVLVERCLDGKPRCLIHKTTYKMNEQIKAFLQPLIPDWEVHCPREIGKGALYSLWPGEDKEQDLEEILSKLGCKRPLDLIHGACEPLALFLSKTIVNHLRKEGKGGEALPTDAHRMALKHLGGKELCEAAKEVFCGDFRHGFDQQGYALFGPDQWKELRGEELNGGLLKVLYYTLGSRKVKKHVASIANTCIQKKTVLAMPLYILNYLFNEKELTKEMLDDLGPKGTAMYDSHAVGLVFDGKGKAVYVADPNGQLIPGGNMEALCVPFKKRGGEPTTREAEYDLEQKKHASV